MEQFVKALHLFCLSPDGVLSLQAEEEALCECPDIVNTMKMILLYVHGKVACIKHFKAG